MPFDPFGHGSSTGFQSLDFHHQQPVYQQHYELEEDVPPPVENQPIHQHAATPKMQNKQGVPRQTSTPQQQQQHPLPTISSSSSSSRPPIGGSTTRSSSTNAQQQQQVFVTPSKATKTTIVTPSPSSTSTPKATQQQPQQQQQKQLPLLAPPPRAPLRLPPKSPASMLNSSSSSIALAALTPRKKKNSGKKKSGGSRRSRSKSRDRSTGGRSRSTSRSRRKNNNSSHSNDSFDSSSSDTDDTDQEDDDRSMSSTRRGRLGRGGGSSSSTTSPSIQDPTPDRLRVETDTDDLSNAPDFQLLTFEPQANTGQIVGTANATTSAGPNITGMVPPSPSQLPQGTISSSNSSSHPNITGVSSGKSCLAVPKILRRGKNQRVQVADVASVGNASDTLVSVNSNVAAEVWQSKPGGRITGRELHETAKAFLNDGDYEQALHLFEAILKAQKDRFGGVEHSSVGAALHNVGVVRLRMAEYDIAEDVLLQALTIRRSVLGPNHLDLAATLAKLGSARSALQKFDEGLGDLRGALQITRKVLGRNHRTVAQILCHIACLYFEAGEMFSAQATFEDALEIYREIFQSEDLADRDAVMAQLTETLCNIGSIQNKRKNFEGAIASFRESVELQQGIMGHDHPRVIASLDNLGYSFSKSKSYNQALACYRQMLSAQISHHGSFTLDCCDTLKKQTVIYDKLKNKDGAIESVTSYFESLKLESEENDPVVMELKQMLVDLQSTKKRIGRSRAKKAEKSDRRRDRSLDCFDRILFDRSSKRGEF